MKKAVIGVVVILVVTVAIWFALTPRGEPISATATCGEAEALESDLGVVNLAQFSLGQSFWVDTARGFAGPIGFITYPDTAVVEAVAADSLGIGFDANLSVRYSGEVTPAVQSELTAEISKSTKLMARNIRRRSLASPLQSLSSDPAARSDILAYLEHSSDAVVFIIHSVMNVDALSIGLEGGVETEAGVHEVSVGNTEVSVTYRCSNVLAIAGTGFPAFFKVMAIGYDESSDRFFAETGVRLDASKISFAHAL